MISEQSSGDGSSRLYDVQKLKTRNFPRVDLIVRKFHLNDYLFRVQLTLGVVTSPAFQAPSRDVLAPALPGLPLNLGLPRRRNGDEACRLLP